ncbi:Bacterial transcription activator, effector binding domain [Microbacterium hydrocarbonoxydans]|uniref:Bacterial transcription activator, effector binding domain n=1 Tax=Microbacterium hydrocarbonoxydans TaxID=273678 RepID=A0A0M2HH34_9MICO|nr:GyrI-like domain-containing protein [Microbacterium hydrocarbonoxydans]KJL46060.1 Bacterial transcription activator, effector binding domain [Microbacterium hydrocarbonoxydans]
MSAFPEDPFGPTDHIRIDTMPLAVIRHEQITLADLRDAFDGGYRAISELFADGRLIHAGPALAVYYGNPMGTFDLELGFPVASAPAEAIESNGLPVTASVLPAGPATATSVFGSYEGLGAAWQGLLQRTLAEGHSSRGIMIEIYVSDPTEAPEALRTDLVLPLA